MEFTLKKRFNEKELKDFKSIQIEAEKIAAEIKPSKTLFMKKYGVKSESEYKLKMIDKGKILKHTPIGWNSWAATAQGFRYVYNALEEAGSYVDSFGVIFDLAMGVPEKYRDKFPIGNGLVLKSQEEWDALGQIVPVQPHLGDQVISSLNSTENLVRGLNAGATTIGNLAQYFTFEYPGLDMEEYRTEEYIKALSIMACFKEQGMVIHSNLDDGYGSQFYDMANLVGWSRLERYIAEDLCGARVDQCYGNLFSDPMHRIIFNRALQMVNQYDVPGSFINGNTIDYGIDLSQNSAALCSYALADIIGQMKYPTGHAISPIPLTEAIRTPKPEEMVQVHRTVDMMIEKAPYYQNFIDWDKIESEAEVLVNGGKAFFERVINALDDMSVDIEHPGEVAAVLKAIGPEGLESAFGSGKANPHAMRGRIPVRPTSIVQTITQIKDDTLAKHNFEENKPLNGVKIVLVATDVHEYGKEVVKRVLMEAGAYIIDLGTAVSVDKVADTITETASKIVAVSTYNGIAYSFAKELVNALKRAELDDVRIFMGGRLNENWAGSDLPVDVSDKLLEMGIIINDDIDTLVDAIAEYSM